MAVCPSCGKSNPPHVLSCGHCGEEIPEQLRAEERLSAAPEPQAIAGPQTIDRPKYCSACGAPLKPLAKACSSCWHPVSGFGTEPGQPIPGDGGQAFAATSSDSTRVLATAGGFLIQLSGCAGIIGGAGLLGFSGWVRSVFGIGIDLIDQAAIVFIGMSIIPIYGGYQALRAKHLGISIIGGIVGTVVCMILWGMLSVMGVAGVILVSLGKDSFSK